MKSPATGEHRGTLDGQRLHHVWRAAEVLAGGDAGLTERLKEARTHLLRSLARPNQWPPDLLAVARSIERIVREQGGTDPLEGMAPDLARQVAEDLLSLAVDDQALFPRGLCKETAAVTAATDGAWQPSQV